MLDRWAKASKKRYKEFIGTDDEESKNEIKLLLYDSYKNGLVDIKSDKQIIDNTHVS